MIYNGDDYFLIESCQERSSVGSLLHYMRTLSAKHKLPDSLSIDIEYHRQGLDASQGKRVGGELRYPDLIVHHRPSSAKNTMVVEFKCRKSTTVNLFKPINCLKDDEDKLKKLVTTYRYSFGCVVLLLKKSIILRILNQRTSLFSSHLVRMLPLTDSSTHLMTQLGRLAGYSPLTPTTTQRPKTRLPARSIRRARISPRQHRR
jgi:hypothetical protein